MRTTRRLEIPDSRRGSGTIFCCLAIVEPEYGGQRLLFGGHSFTEKIITNVYCEKSVVTWKSKTRDEEVEPFFVVWRLLNLSTGVSSSFSVATILQKK